MEADLIHRREIIGHLLRHDKKQNLSLKAILRTESQALASCRVHNANKTRRLLKKLEIVKELDISKWRTAAN